MKFAIRRNPRTVSFVINLISLNEIKKSPIIGYEKPHIIIRMAKKKLFT